MRRAIRGAIRARAAGTPRRPRAAGPRFRRARGSSWTLRGAAEVAGALAIVAAAALFVFGWFSKTTVLVSLGVLVLGMLLSAGGMAGGGTSRLPWRLGK